MVGEKVACPIKNLSDPSVCDRFPKLAAELLGHFGGSRFRLLRPNAQDHVKGLVRALFLASKGIHYLVLEFVAGQSLSEHLARRGSLTEREALALITDVCRALADAHCRDIVHRDIKPDNILLKISGGSEHGLKVDQTDGDGTARLTPVLTDFGLARHAVESESLSMTHTGAILGTPSFMSPEQCSGGSVDPRSDVYSIGATLFCLLAGRPPFEADNPQSVMAMHTGEPAPSLDKLNPAISEAVCRIVEKTLAKRPEHRYPDAAALLDELERALRGEATSIVVHPRLPQCDPNKILHYNWSWDLESAPETLWPHVSNTERFNRAVGLPAVEFSNETDAEGRVKWFGRFRKLGMTAAWRGVSRRA